MASGPLPWAPCLVLNPRCPPMCPLPGFPTTLSAPGTALPLMPLHAQHLPAASRHLRHCGGVGRGEHKAPRSQGWGWFSGKAKGGRASPSWL